MWLNRLKAFYTWCMPSLPDGSIWWWLILKTIWSQVCLFNHLISCYWCYFIDCANWMFNYSFDKILSSLNYIIWKKNVLQVMFSWWRITPRIERQHMLRAKWSRHILAGPNMFFTRPWCTTRLVYRRCGILWCTFRTIMYTILLWTPSRGWRLRFVRERQLLTC